MLKHLFLSQFLVLITRTYTASFMIKSPPSYRKKYTISFERNEENKVSSTTSTSAQVMEEASDALNNVGWAPPMNDEEMTSDDPFVKSIDDGIRADFGVGLNELLNPAKVVNLERDLYNLRIELASLTGRTEEIEDKLSSLTTEMVDGGGESEDIMNVRRRIQKREGDLSIERRAVFRSWLKNLFLGQGILSFGLSWIMVSNPSLLFDRFTWYNDYSLELPIEALGFWWWWLFIIPSLRSRRPSGSEKQALDIAFLGTPLVSLAAPIVTKDPSSIWFANLLVVVGAYGYAFLFESEDDSNTKNQPEWLKFVYKSLDFGTGKERGVRK